MELNKKRLQISEIEDLDELITLYYEVLIELKNIDVIKKSLRLKIIDTMKELKIKSAFIVLDNGERINAYISFPKSFDLGTCRMDNPEIVKDFVEVIEKVVEEETFDKRTFILSHPELYEKYMVELTPRLTVK